MPVDPSIILQGPKPADPTDLLTKAMTLKELGLRAQGQVQANQMNAIKLGVEQREAQDQQTVRDAYQKNMQVTEDGVPVLNRQQFLSDLGNSSNPALAMQKALEFRQMDLDTLNQRHEVTKSALLGVNDQDSYSQALQTLKSNGTNIQGWPQQYDPDFVRGRQMQMLKFDEQLAQQNKQQDLAIQKQKADIEQQQLALSLKKNDSENVQQTLQALQSARGNKAVMQAESDIYSAAKVNKLAAQVKNLDQLSPTQNSLLAHETLKMASGGQGTEEELKALKPGTPQYQLAELGQKLKNAPVGAKAGAFARQLIDYANGMADDGRDLLKENYGGVIETKKPYLPKASYDIFNQQFMGRLNGTVAPGTPWSGAQTGPAAGASQTSPSNAHPQDAQAVAWAKANSKDPRAAKILKLNGE